METRAGCLPNPRDDDGQADSRTLAIDAQYDAVLGRAPQRVTDLDEVGTNGQYAANLTTDRYASRSAAERTARCDAVAKLSQVSTAAARHGQLTIGQCNVAGAGWICSVNR